MFNLFPGSGLGTTGSKLIAFGLGLSVTIEVIAVRRNPIDGGITFDSDPFRDQRWREDEEIISIIVSFVIKETS